MPLLKLSRKLQAPKLRMSMFAIPTPSSLASLLKTSSISFGRDNKELTIQLLLQARDKMSVAGSSWSQMVRAQRNCSEWIKSSTTSPVTMWWLIQRTRRFQKDAPTNKWPPKIKWRRNFTPKQVRSTELARTIIGMEPWSLKMLTGKMLTKELLRTSPSSSNQSS